MTNLISFLFSLISYHFLLISSQTTVDEKLQSPEVLSPGYFGSDVSIWKDVAVVGALGHLSPTAVKTGASYVYNYNSTGNWVYHMKLVPSDGRADDYFGNIVSNQENMIAIGSMYHDLTSASNAGAVYVYEFDFESWTQSAKLIAFDASQDDNFGVSLRLGNNTLVIGSYRDDDKGQDSGSGYIFTRITSTLWTLEAKLLSSDGASGDYFGVATDIDIFNQRIVMSSFGDDSARGSVYVFQKSSLTQKWSQMSKLIASDRRPSYFGLSLKMDQNTLVVGATRDESINQFSAKGSAYVFERSNSLVNPQWSQVAKLRASDLTTTDFMGGAVALSGNAILVNTEDDDRGENSGRALILSAVYVFQRPFLGSSLWSQQMKLVASDSNQGDYFGLCLSLYETKALLAAPYKDDSTLQNAGAVYSYTLTSPPTPQPTISLFPTISPSFVPSAPTSDPTFSPSSSPSVSPSIIPSFPTVSPSIRPTRTPSIRPTPVILTSHPTDLPTQQIHLSGNHSNEKTSKLNSIIFAVFISLILFTCCLGIICCVYQKKNRINSEGEDGEYGEGHAEMIAFSVNPEEASRHVMANVVMMNSNQRNGGIDPLVSPHLVSALAEVDEIPVEVDLPVALVIH